ncbi:MAG: 4Fe-4S dicluster domain-containing protein [Bacteroidia bacterium]|nr:4Fe-4S dicluster domain-containing protein [Bacteroidia bacterium]MCF8425836.1 4Fe-4S dicluster domain-containing protein [Bacteroidia bacterium]MCF8447428.1 4Fe-4S dicluster domain-containing protein [Bacteroidia bacterium]
MKNEKEDSNRRNFLKLGLLAGTATLTGLGVKNTLFANAKEETGEKVKVLTVDGKVVEVDSSLVAHPSEEKLSQFNVREGIPGKKFIMVIDLARCANARKCVEGCQSMHGMLPPIEYIKVKKMQDSELAAPYWFPQTCYQCDNPPCTKVCPVDATFKRSDGIVGIDSDRCIGCKFCMAACPYSARTFNFGRPEQQAFSEEHAHDADKCCTTKSSQEGTVSKCDFCPESSSKGILPSCVTECPNGTIFFGDELEDAVTNGEETFRLSELLTKRAGYRQFEELGTKPRVYYLPPVERNFPFEDATEVFNQQE